MSKEAEEYFTKEWGTGFINATLKEKGGLLQLSMKDVYDTMEDYLKYSLKNGVPRKNRLTDLAIKECKGCWDSEGCHLGVSDEELNELDALIELYEKQSE